MRYKVPVKDSRQLAILVISLDNYKKSILELKQSDKNADREQGRWYEESIANIEELKTTLINVMPE